MSNYNYKEKKIIKQCNEGPYHTLITKLTVDEFNNLVAKTACFVKPEAENNQSICR